MILFNRTNELIYNLDSNDQLLPKSSKYYTEKQMTPTINSIGTDNLFLLQYNIRSLNKHFDQFRLLLENSFQDSLPVIGLTETWLYDYQSQYFFVI